MVFFKSHQIIIKRERNISGLQYHLSATFTVYETDLQPVEANRIQQIGGRIGKTYEAWFDPEVELKEGDHIQIVETGKRFAVSTVSTFEGAGLLDHKSAIVEALD